VISIIGLYPFFWELVFCIHRKYLLCCL